ncbi:enoyl-CoA hydratase/isomerase family protein [Martelella radicis]|uniref:Enoyl-CoA hydratase/carnithine racemase n=1 Tax=Martelella radicis TaxID=1397476 RepID=A0A7W6KML8_9HYPH|nr:enoyl-CoA hydratase/isomerase family protein [Martelella radicis]MBB4124109.1 enoyl-CoA hydratase/carnithine racemase [Martelella radicis]
MSEEITVERREGFAILTMNRPARRNALGATSMAALFENLKALAVDPECAAVVLTGAPPAFCAGSDLKELGGLSVADMCEHEAETARIARAIGLLPIPVIAAVEGYALGGGFILAVSCDIVVSAAGAKWNMPEVRNGWLPPWGLQALLARTSAANARLITWGIMEIDGNEARRLGIADAVAPDGAALETACTLAGRLAALPANAVASAKRFFEIAASADAERKDAEAGRLFAQDCESVAAKAVLSRFTVK